MDNVRNGEEVMTLTNGGTGYSADNGMASPWIGVMSIDVNQAAPGYYGFLGKNIPDANGAAHEMGHDIGLPDTYHGNYRPPNLMGNDNSTSLTTDQFDKIFTSAILDIGYSRKQNGQNLSNYSNVNGRNKVFGQYKPNYRMTPQQRVNLHFKK